MGWDMIDESAWQRNKAVSLTYCWSWDETWLMRVPGKEIKQSHSHSVGHAIRHGETAWQRKHVVQLLTLYYIRCVWDGFEQVCNVFTSCFPCQRLIRLPWKSTVTDSLKYAIRDSIKYWFMALTSYWLWDEIIRWKQVQYHLLPVGHNMRCAFHAH